jgi:hypothetical protein
MTPPIEDVRYLEGFKIWIKFEDGTEGAIDLTDELWGEVFEPLRDVNIFRTVRLDRELDTICWDNGADFAPETLYHKIASVPA